MLSAKQRREIVEFAEKRYKSNDPVHTMKHIRRVVRFAVKLARMEHGDRDVCWTAAMLHDIAKDEKGDHGARGAKQARKFLIGIGVDKDAVERIREVMYYHNKGFVGGSIERQIVWDADKLDAFTLSGVKNRLVPSIRMRALKNTIKDARRQYLLYLGRFHTKTGKRLSKKESAAVNRYFTRLEKQAERGTYYKVI